MAIAFPSNLDVAIRSGLDVRYLVVNRLASVDNYQDASNFEGGNTNRAVLGLDADTLYNGMIVYQTGGTSGLYILNDSSDHTDEANWSHVVLPPGGTEDQALIKQSADNYDADWVDLSASHALINTAIAGQTALIASTLTTEEIFSLTLTGLPTGWTYQFDSVMSSNSSFTASVSSDGQTINATGPRTGNNASTMLTITATTTDPNVFPESTGTQTLVTNLDVYEPYFTDVITTEPTAFIEPNISNGFVLSNIPPVDDLDIEFRPGTDGNTEYAILGLPKSFGLSLVRAGGFAIRPDTYEGPSSSRYDIHVIPIKRETVITINN